jgi:predicted outer membrane protein
LIAASPANAQQNAGSGQTGGVAFVRDTGNAGRFEVLSSRLALERSQHVGVRGNAGGPQHRPAGPTGQLSGLSGPDFDRAYMPSQIDVGELLKQAFTEYGATGESPTVRVYAAKAVTGYEAQLLQARAIAGSLWRRFTTTRRPGDA